MMSDIRFDRDFAIQTQKMIEYHKMHKGTGAIERSPGCDNLNARIYGVSTEEDLQDLPEREADL